MIKYAFSDVDGTLYSYDRIIKKETIEDIKAFQAKGNEFVICTGNPYIDNMVELSKQLNVRYNINSNGATIFDRKLNKFIYSKTFNAKLANEMLQFCDARKMSTLWWDETNIYVSNHIDQEIMDLLTHCITNNKFMTQSNHIKKDIIKFECHSSEKNIKDFMEHFKDSDLEILHMESGSLEISKKDVSKGSAIKWFTNHLSISDNDYMTIGDSTNDVSMFKISKHSYAMDNAGDHVKKHTANVTGHIDSNGLGQALKGFGK